MAARQPVPGEPRRRGDAVRAGDVHRAGRGDRRRARDGGRARFRRLRVQPRDPGHPAAGFRVQAVRLRDGDRGRHPGIGDHLRPAVLPRECRRRSLRAAQLRQRLQGPADPAASAGPVDQHRGGQAGAARRRGVVRADGRAHGHLIECPAGAVGRDRFDGRSSDRDRQRLQHLREPRRPGLSPVDSPRGEQGRPRALGEPGPA